MGTTKTHKFSSSQNEIAQLFKVLGHPARIAIIEYIGKQKDCICANLVSELGLAQATISQHLAELKQANLIKGEIDGKKMCYCINETKWEVVKDLCSHFFMEIDPNCCVNK